MSQRFVPPANGSALDNAALTNLASDIASPLVNIDHGRYGSINTAFSTLVPQVLPGTQFTVTGASWSAGVATVTVGSNAFPTGQRVVVASIVSSGPGSYNTTPADSTVLLTGGGTTITFTLASNPGSWTSGGTVTAYGTPTAGMLAVDIADGKLKRYNGSAWVIVDSTAGTKYRSSAYQNGAAQSITNGTWTSVTFDTNIEDVGSIHSTSSNTSRFVAPAAGTYLFICRASFAVNATGTRFCRIVVNGITTLAQRSSNPVPAAYPTILEINFFVTLAANDYLELQVFQDSGGALLLSPLTSNQASNSAEMVLLNA